MRFLKKYLGFIVFCFGSVVSFGQSNINFAYHDKLEAIGWSVSGSALAEINGDYYFSSRKLDASGYSSVFLYKVTSNGNLVFRKKLNIGFISPVKLIKTLDNKLLFIANEAMCDVVPSYQPNYIFKIDTSGAITFTNSYTEYFGNFFSHVVQQQDSTYYVFSDSVMYHYSKAGVLLLRKNIGLKQISSALMHPSGDVLLSAVNNSVNTINRMNSSGIITFSLASNVLLKKMAFYNGNQIMGLGNDGALHKYSSNYVPIGSSAFPFTMSLSDMVVSNDSIYCISSNATPIYLISDSVFNVVSLNNSTIVGLTQKTIIKKQNKIAVLSEALSKNSNNWPNNHLYVTLNVFDKFQSNNVQDDIESVAVTNDSSYVTSLPTQTTSNSPRVYDYYLRAKVKLKNKGNANLNSFKLNCFLNPYISCGNYYYQQKFDGFSVAPGETLEVLTDFIQKTTYTTGLVPSSINHTVCLFASVPNSKADKDPLNNEVCLSVTYTTDVSVNEDFIMNYITNVYPNPFESKFVIESSTNIKKINLFDQLGRILYSKITDASQAVLELENFDSGIYFLQIKTEKGSEIKKVIKH